MDNDIKIVALICIAATILTLGVAALFIRPIIAGVIIAVVCGFISCVIFSYVTDDVNRSLWQIEYEKNLKKKEKKNRVKKY